LEYRLQNSGPRQEKRQAGKKLKITIDWGSESVFPLDLLSKKQTNHNQRHCCPEQRPHEEIDNNGIPQVKWDHVDG